MAEPMTMTTANDYVRSLNALMPALEQDIHMTGNDSIRVRDLLSDLGIALREETLRNEINADAIATILVTILAWHSDRIPLPSYRNILEQIGRVAANMGADNVRNLDSLLAHEYPQHAVAVLNDLAAIYHPYARTVSASLFNAYRSGHDSTNRLLAKPQFYLNLLKAAVILTVDTSQDRVLNFSAALWLWEILAGVSEDRYKVNDPAAFAEEFGHIAGLLRGSIPYSDGEGREHNSNDLLHSPLEILELACQILVASLGEDRDSVAALSDAADIDARNLLELAQFIESGRHDHWLDGISHDDGDSAALANEAVQRFAACKSSLIHVVVSSSWSLTYSAHALFWKKMVTWISVNDRDDMASCGLLCLANSARDALSAGDLITTFPEVLPEALKLISSTTSAHTMHAVLGLLKHLALRPAPSLKVSLDTIPERLLAAGLWTRDWDICAPVQISSVSLVRHIYHNNRDAAIRNTGVGLVETLVSMLERTDEQSLKFEGTRLITTLIKLSFSPPAHSDVLISCLALDRPVRLLTATICLGQAYPLLINEAVVGLALLVTFGPTSISPVVTSALQREVKFDSQPTPISAMSTLENFAVSATSKPEIVKNVQTLFEVLRDRPRITD